MVEEAWMQNTEDFSNWDPTKVAAYLKEKADLGEYYEMILNHKISGEVAPRLSDQDLKEMGIASIGDRKRFIKALEDLQKHQRRLDREKVVWEGQEVLWFSCWEACCTTCCGCFPVDPATYKLTGTHLIIKTHYPPRCGPVRCCCATEFDVDNTDLTHLVDADVKGLSPPCWQQICCCGKPRDHIEIKTNGDGEKLLKLEKGQGEVVAKKILNQVEEAQQMERD